MTRVVGALVPLNRDRPPPAIGTLPMGKAALELLEEDIVVLLGDATHGGTMTGFQATTSGWEPVAGVPVTGVYDRYPAPKDPSGHAVLLQGLTHVPVGNAASIRALSSDKLHCQQHLEARGIPMPPVVDRDFGRALAEFGAAFAKPRFGASGCGVRRVTPGEDVPAMLDGALGHPEPTLLQQAVPPPDGWAGISTRVLVQRTPTGWAHAPPVARRSRSDWVVNVGRGAEAVPAEDALSKDTFDALVGVARSTAMALADHPDGALLLEVGVDAMIDNDGHPWVIETNTRPWGRLSALAKRWPERFERAHIDACARPFRYLASLSGTPPKPTER